MTIHIWRPHWKHEKVREGDCRASVGRGRMGLGQCGRKGKRKGKVDGKTYLLCAQHHPDAVAKREKEWEERYEADRKRDSDRYARRRLERETMQLLANLDEAKIPKAVRDWVRKWKELERKEAP